MNSFSSFFHRAARSTTLNLSRPQTIFRTFKTSFPNRFRHRFNRHSHKKPPPPYTSYAIPPFLPMARRFTAFKFAGYSFGALTLVILGPIILWPLADVYILPRVICRSLEHIPDDEKEIWGRENEMKQLQAMMEEPANNVQFYFLCMVCVGVLLRLRIGVGVIQSGASRGWNVLKKSAKFLECFFVVIEKLW